MRTTRFHRWEIAHAYSQVYNAFMEAFDTLPLAKGLGYPGKLVELSEALGVELSNAHEALADTHALASVLLKLLDLSNTQVDSPVFQPSLFTPEPSGLFELRPITK